MNKNNKIVKAITIIINNEIEISSVKTNFLIALPIVIS